MNPSWSEIITVLKKRGYDDDVIQEVFVRYCRKHTHPEHGLGYFIKAGWRARIALWRRRTHKGRVRTQPLRHKHHPRTTEAPQHIRMEVLEVWVLTPPLLRDHVWEKAGEGEKDPEVGGTSTHRHLVFKARRTLLKKLTH